MTKSTFVASAFLTLLVAAAVGQNSVTQNKKNLEKPDFERDVQPILAANCYKCHGPKVQMARLRLDAKRTALAGGQSGKVILPGSADKSILYQRISGLSKQERMPMGPTALGPEEISTIRNWINQGADWPDNVGVQISELNPHWAFVPPVKPVVPPVKEPRRAHNPIDNFILAKLNANSLGPSPEADKATLLRRLSLDLIGLPPSIEELNTFLSDETSSAYEKQVDRLLASPHYGERWGRVWLDGARYADSNGYEKDAPRSMWSYRDWVIRALNKDLPYNQFIVDQIAGDLLPHPTQDQVVATGFLRNSMVNEEGGVDPEQFRMEAMFDRMDAIGKGILGLTIQCAQCHNHKFDPLKQEEYYRMMAFLNNTNEASAIVYNPDQLMKRAKLLAERTEIEDTLRHGDNSWQGKMTAWENSIAHNQPDWTIIRPEVDDISTGGSRYLPQPDGSFLVLGYAPPIHKVKFTAKLDTSNIKALRLELLTDPNLPCGGPGRSINGTGVLTEFEAEAAPANDPTKFKKIKFVAASSDFEPPTAPLAARYQVKSGAVKLGGSAQLAIDGKDNTGWNIDAGPGLRNQSRKAVFVSDQPIGYPGGTVLQIYLNQRGGNEEKDDDGQNSLGRMRLSFTTSDHAVADPVPSDVREILSIPADQRSPGQMRTVFSYWRQQVPEWRAANDQISALWREYPEGTSQLVLSKRSDARETHLLKRGNFLTPDRVVSPGVPAFLPQMPADTSPDRLAFANWLAARNSPTTARSIVNRVWQSYFGTGIVASSENFGTQSDPPSHQELLDWLAVQFMDEGWSLKKLHRLIVTSATYRQSSQATPDMLAKDPSNRLLERGPRFRVDAEIVRDIALDASGLLDSKIGGPSVHPFAPEFLFLPPASYAKKSWVEDHGPDRYRRALYTFRFRSTPYPILQAFDAPNGDIACVRRPRSNTPLQALATLNEPIFVESARALALRTLKAGGRTDSERLSYAFRLCVARKPTAQEQLLMLSFLRKQESRLSTGWLSARDLTGFTTTEKSPLPATANPNQWAAWTALSRVLLNMDETITKE
jgi:hypothetical protein